MSALELMVRLAVRLPSAPGVKLSPTVQDAPMPSGDAVLQVPLRLKSAAWVPLRLNEENVRGAVPLLVTVTLEDPLDPSCTSP